MILLENTLISLDILEEHFVCDLQNCKGLCCSEGDYGAPLDDSEIDLIKSNLDGIREYMPPKALVILEKEGFCEKDIENVWVTKCLENKDCIFAFKDMGIFRCAIEKAFLNKKTNFLKPVSCHLYPIRLMKLNEYIAVNYSEWSICKPACALGKELKKPLYVFLRKPLERRFGKEWYKELQRVAKEYFREKS